ncbi:putative E3 ubiquitin-protein ligase hrd-1 [Glarea lozoyensis 74030]|uniref:Putative E3 ubiquitin-protein ligase hrd-1 n=1 Tax=Glarea lozoyensis (strain ATCC 74030 / MF5533) TaxID=1104152 RepID=H0EL15_GLAL7|nr:putative E3 ubiquitin-protein ligase hrd-1 [Glarea lozoyensis 74030]
MDGPARIRRGLDISDDDEDSDLERESNEIYRREEELSRRENELARREDGNEERAMAVLRGAIALGKRVPSKAAIASLQVVKVEDLKEADKTCIICYNEFGAANPEGLVEQPLRLPKCKHVFGDTCIKKWFEDSDTCPYCRDKLPAELSMSRGAALESLRAQRERLAAAMQYRRAQAGGGPRFPFLPEGTLESLPLNEHRYLLLANGRRYRRIPDQVQICHQSIGHRRGNGATSEPSANSSSKSAIEFILLSLGATFPASCNWVE